VLLERKKYGQMKVGRSVVEKGRARQISKGDVGRSVLKEGRARWMSCKGSL